MSVMRCSEGVGLLMVRAVLQSCLLVWGQCFKR